MGQTLASEARNGVSDYRRAYREYFDDYTCVAVYSAISLCDLLTANGLALIRLYLLSPWKPFAKQMFVRACVSDSRGTA
jgi:hypothetical protein